MFTLHDHPEHKRLRKRYLNSLIFRKSVTRLCHTINKIIMETDIEWMNLTMLLKTSKDIKLKTKTKSPSKNKSGGIDKNSPVTCQKNNCISKMESCMNIVEEPKAIFTEETEEMETDLSKHHGSNSSELTETSEMSLGKTVITLPKLDLNPNAAQIAANFNPDEEFDSD